MRFSVLVALIAYATFAIVQLASATPVLSTKDMVVKRDNADIVSVLNKLKTSVASPISEINNLAETKTANPDNIKPPIQQIISALNTAASDLAALEPASVRKRQSNDEVAQLIAGIISDLVTAIGRLLDFAELLPILGELLPGLDTALNQVLLGLGILLAGVLNLVATLLVNVAALLRSLALDLTLGTLGL